MPLIPLAVTTSRRPASDLVEYARLRAGEWGLPFLEHGDGQLATALLVFGAGGVVLRDPGGCLRFHAGMAQLRRLRLDAGEGDALVRVAGLRPGDHVLDGTLGLAQDALVAARAVGPAGRVVGVEKSLALYAVVSEGLARLEPGVAAVHGDTTEYLRHVGDRSFDVVLLDPMFDRPGRAQPAFAALRRHADHAPLTAALVAAARRVARRAVVIKAARYSRDLERLGLAPEPASPYSPVVWAVVGVG